MRTKVLLLFVIMFIQMILNAQNNKWFQKGIDAKDPKEKIEYYSKSIIKEGPSSAAYNNRGLAKYHLQDYDGAIGDFNQSIAIEPKIAITYLNRGDTKKCLQDYDGAISDYKKYFERTPNAINANIPLPNTVNFKMDSVGGNIQYSSTVQMFGTFQFDSLNIDILPVSISYSGSDVVPRFLSVFDNLGYCYLAKEEYSSAMKYFNKCIAFKSDFIDAILGMSLAYYYQNDSVNAKKYFEQAKALKSLLQQGISGFETYKKEGFICNEHDNETLRIMFSKWK